MQLAVRYGCTQTDVTLVLGAMDPTNATSFVCPCRQLQILGKAEFLNPGGSVKDRVALRIIDEVHGTPSDRYNSVQSAGALMP